MGKQNSDTINANKDLSKEDGLPKTIENTGSGVDMCLPYDAISLPPQQPPSVVPEILISNMSTLVHDEKVADVSARLDSEQLDSAMDGAQSKEPDNLDRNSSLSLDGLHPMEQYKCG